MNNSGKTLIIILVVISVLSISLATISLFFFAKEVDVNKSLDENLEILKIKEDALQKEARETKQQVFLLEEKNKEFEAGIESLMEDLELEVGLREEIKKDNKDLKASLETAIKAKDDLQDELGDKLSGANERIEAIQQELKVTVERNKELDAQKQVLQSQYQKLKMQLGEMSITPITEIAPFEAAPAEAAPAEAAPKVAGKPNDNVSLKRIVVSPPEEGEGKIITIDAEAEFIIVDLGENNGIAKGVVLSIYREDNHIGDVKVSRVLPEMSAADFVPPLTSKDVRKDDRVLILKK